MSDTQAVLLGAGVTAVVIGVCWVLSAMNSAAESRYQLRGKR